jgi:peptidoglycan/xylan/chitin deacetylase (PgdA/CDA1 family)
VTFKRLRQIAIVPLSLIPFAIAVPGIASSHHRYQREHASDPYAAPAVKVSARERAAMPPFEIAAGGIPVLVWHGIGPQRDGYTVTQHAFARQLALLRGLGFESIGSAQYAAFRAHKPVKLPAKPILLTFDDGRLDSYRGADLVLERERMRATMFVITGRIKDVSDDAVLTWAELHEMHRSGRWDIEAHGDSGHRLIPTDGHGGRAPFYAARRFTRSTGYESLADWEARTTTDVLATRSDLLVQGFAPHLFALPYGDYGQHRPDTEIPRLLSALLERQFGTFFTQPGEPAYSRPGSGAAPRLEVHTSTGLASLYSWLRYSAPATDSKD